MGENELSFLSLYSALLCSETTGSSCFFPHRRPHLCHVITLDGWATGKWPGMKTRVESLNTQSFPSRAVCMEGQRLCEQQLAWKQESSVRR